MKTTSQHLPQTDLDEQLLTLAKSGCGHLDEMKAVIAAGANVHAKDELALFLAVNRGDVEKADLLLESGAIIHTQNQDALDKAAQKGDVPMIRHLLGHKIDEDVLCQKIIPWSLFNKPAVFTACIDAIFSMERWTDCQPHEISLKADHLTGCIFDFISRQTAMAMPAHPLERGLKLIHEKALITRRALSRIRVGALSVHSLPARKKAL